jgi:5-methylcytosine-specific restriction endonuclease McrA
MPKNSKKPTRSKLVKKLDVVFSEYVRLSNSDDKGICTCVTCGKKGYWKNDGIQAGHFMSRRHYSTRWDIRNVHPQCVGCNVVQWGQQYKYSVFLGKSLSEELFIKSQEIIKFTSDELQDLIKKYSEELKEFL